MCADYSEEMGKNAIALVHDQLETFKYVGGFVQDPRNPGAVTESGEGLPLSIVALPDFVLDFHQDNLGSNSPVCSVGGHAGHIASTLLHLMSDEDATHRVHFLTRTGRLATMLLEDEFQAGIPESSHDTYKRYCEPFVFIRDGQPRCAYLSGRDIEPSRCKPGDEMRAQEEILKQPFVVESIRAAHAVYIGSFKTPDYTNILGGVLETIGDGMLFLDTRRADKESCDKLERMFITLKKWATPKHSALKPEIVLFVRNPEYQFVIQTAGSVLERTNVSPQDIARELKIRLLYYTDSSIDLYTDFDGETSGPLLCSPSCQITTTLPSLRFCAGVILAASVHRTLGLLAQTAELRTKKLTRAWGNSLRKSFDQRWQRIGGPWMGIAAYGVACASLALDNRGFSLRDDVLGKGVTPMDVPMEEVDRTLRIRLESSAIGDFARLAARRRCQGLANKLTAQCDPVQDGHECVIEERKTAVMLDLDGTLMDSTSQRGRALDPALAKLHAISQLLPDDFKQTCNDSVTRLRFFEEHVYDLHPFFEWLGVGDFRQQWNRRGWYATYIVLARLPLFGRDIIQAAGDWNRIKKNDKLQPKDKEKLCEALRKRDAITAFQRECESVLRSRTVEIGEAIRAFSDVQLHPLKEARDLLTSLKQSGAFNLYVVSEGAPETQWEKLRSIGLSDFFGRSHVLTTGDVVPEYDNERRQFSREQDELRRRLEDARREYAYAHGGIDLAEIESDICRFPGNDVSDDVRRKWAMSVRNKYRERQLKNEARLEHKIRQIGRDIQVATCVETVLARLRDKLSLAFYGAVIRAIMRNPERPLDTLRDLQKIRREEVGTPRMKLAMVGDRQTKDLHPPLELLVDPHTHVRKGLITIRLLSGKYAVDKEDDPDRPDYPYSPDFLALTLAHVKAILLSRSAWKRVQCLDQEPPLFNWVVNLQNRTHIPQNPKDNTESIGINHILGGMSLSSEDFPVISNICAAFLTECVSRCSEKEIDEILTLLFKTDDDPLDEERCAARLSAFVLAGALTTGKIAETVEDHFATELARCRRVVHTAWVKERVLNALHWLRNHARSSAARNTADQAVA
jgi:FMN phosphatase YigB (HAD superfamily)